MIEAVLETLQGDAALASLLPGGVHGGMEISRQATPDAFDAFREIRPCALVKATVRTPWGPYDHSARLYFVIYLYQQRGNETISQAAQRIYELLHRQKLTPALGDAADGCWEIVHADDALGLEDPALGLPMATSRYVATMLRAIETS